MARRLRRTQPRFWPRRHAFGLRDLGEGRVARDQRVLQDHVGHPAHEVLEARLARAGLHARDELHRHVLVLVPAVKVVAREADPHDLLRPRARGSRVPRVVLDLQHIVGAADARADARRVRHDAAGGAAAHAVLQLLLARRDAGLARAVAAALRHRHAARRLRGRSRP